MAINISRGRPDAVLHRIIDSLRPYEADHAAAQVDLYRMNNVSVRVRIVDPDLAHLSRVQRHDLVWEYLDALPEDVLSDISMLVLLAPGEEQTSGSNLEFDDPVPQVMA